MTDADTEVPTTAVGDYVLPKPPRGGEVPLTIAATSSASASLRRAEAARQLGARSLALVECQQQFLAEVRERLEGLDIAIAEDSRARLKGAVRATVEVLDWCDAVQRDLQRETQFACQGWLPHDLASFCAELAAAQTGGQVLVAGTTATAWWGDGAVLATLLAAGIELVRERTSGQGAVLLEVADAEGVHTVRIASSADAVEDVDPASATRFRALADRLGAAVMPDRLGVAAPGMVVRLPASAAE
ncbi:MAG: hypothetical protein H6838_08515 [Planctomycetes bacterium]|nr:hypothetical protein [Planctomycetota bacterium]